MGLYTCISLQPERYAGSSRYGDEYYGVQALKPFYIGEGQQQGEEYKAPQVNAAKKRAA